MIIIIIIIKKRPRKKKKKKKTPWKKKKKTYNKKKGKRKWSRSSYCVFLVKDLWCHIKRIFFFLILFPKEYREDLDQNRLQLSIIQNTVLGIKTVLFFLCLLFVCCCRQWQSTFLSLLRKTSDFTIFLHFECTCQNKVPDVGLTCPWYSFMFEFPVFFQVTTSGLDRQG